MDSIYIYNNFPYNYPACTALYTQYMCEYLFPPVAPEYTHSLNHVCLGSLFEKMKNEIFWT